MSALVRSFTRHMPTSGMMWGAPRPVSVMIMVGFMGRPPLSQDKAGVQSVR